MDSESLYPYPGPDLEHHVRLRPFLVFDRQQRAPVSVATNPLGPSCVGNFDAAAVHPLVDALQLGERLSGDREEAASGVAVAVDLLEMVGDGQADDGVLS